MKPVNYKRYSPLGASLIIAAMSVSQAFAAHIDFIQDDSNPGNGVTNATFNLSSSNATVVSSSQMGEPADILGGTRNVSLSRNGGFGGSVTATKAAGTDVISFRTSNFLPTGLLSLDYPGITNANFMTLWDAITIDIPKLDNAFPAGNGIFDITVGVRSSAGNGSVTLQRIDDPGTFDFLFSDPGFAGVDFADVDGVTVSFQTLIIGTQFDVGSIVRRDRAVMQGVPDGGSSLVLLGVSLGGLGMGRFLKTRRK